MKDKIKTSILLGSLALLVVASAAQFNRIEAIAAQPPARREVVILYPYHLWQRYSDGSQQYAGMVIQNSSSSAGAPQFQNHISGGTNPTNGADLAEASAQLLSEGFRMEKNGEYFIFTK